ncbi:MAG: hypothetical protein JEY94_15605 [Melioribacteraceae bacterium]|nr:hypothetical protein [Melioribacteraceae bacterium]
MFSKFNLRNNIDLIDKLFRYNLKIIFANKFIYFLLAAVGFFIFVTIVSLFSSSDSNVQSVYYLQLFPGILLIFYPTTFGIQNDEDSRMLEIIFSIPNYRYKVWLVRMIIIYIIVFALLIVLSILSYFAIAVVPIFEMSYQLMYPIFFLGSFAFMISTVIRNGNGSAIIMIIIGLVFWISSGILQYSEWNIFLNPFDLPRDVSEVIWQTVMTNNRLYLLAGIILTQLFGLFNLQNREKFV